MVAHRVLVLCAQKKRRSKWTTYHHYSPSLSSWCREQSEARDEIGSSVRHCHQCNTTKSPEWRSGPLGSKTYVSAALPPSRFLPPPLPFFPSVGGSFGALADHVGSIRLCNACGIRYSKTLRQEKVTNPLSIKNLLN